MRISYFYKTAVSALICSAVVGMMSGCYLLPDEEEVLPAPTVKASEVSYTTVTAKRKTLEKKIVNSGTVMSEQQYNIAYEKEGGTISEFYVRAGDKVAKGDKICELDTTDIDYQIQLKELDRKRAYLYTEVLYEKGCTQSEYDRAYVDVELLDIALKKLYKQRDNAVLTSPTDGTICALADVRVGDYASPGQTIATIMQTDKLYIAIKPNDLTAFPLGQKVQIRIGEDYYDGEVFMNPTELAEYKREESESHDKKEEGGIEYEADMIYIRFAGEAPPDAVGQLADSILVQERAENVIVVSNNLIKTVDGEQVVYVLREGQKVAVPVEIGLKTGSQSEIKSGLNEGDEIIIR
ncbi:Multidrug efflux pump subunit AcrA (membrane-fusion protein) [Ruminococcus sp. YE71]|uniref:efflux RND transporter periplasmic adaptor subunit n=1 Tax=unclassified Ruminococcus TaxID=2608920 RepID=UPI00088008E2|nr:MULTISPECIES: biotin/lipoyl-binding protein [unclassified Ruminococcus]SDA16761.1 Multidrug efflux pump subunit AcrA (membrane-fusion protein) [Ruminococcus sp. YE78]SFW25589.1 Multidrug efflux pump subunit AcrA (membrane-fusion protein) [Ruminococcus sp. YE71]